MNLREQACWLLLVFESKLSIRTINDILVIWCKQLGRTIEDFFEASSQEWSATCNLNGEAIQKLERAREKQVGQAFLVEKLQHDAIAMVTVLDPEYPKLLKLALTRSHIPPVLFYAGDLALLQRHTIAIIGSRNASETSLDFTRATAHFLAERGANVISGNARGVDRAAYEGAKNSDGCTTVVLPHGIHKLSKVQWRDVQTGIEAGNVLVLSQFHPDAPWMMSRAMERNNVVTGLAQVVIVAESDSKGGTWEGANGALKQKRNVYVRDTPSESVLPGNKLLLEKTGVFPLSWPTKNIAQTLAPVLYVSDVVHEKQQHLSTPPSQLSLLAISQE